MERHIVPMIDRDLPSVQNSAGPGYTIKCSARRRLCMGERIRGRRRGGQQSSEARTPSWGRSGRGRWSWAFGMAVSFLGCGIVWVEAGGETVNELF